MRNKLAVAILAGLIACVATVGALAKNGPLRSNRYLQIGLNCPSYGTGTLEMIYRNVQGVTLSTKVTYADFEPVFVELHDGDTGTIYRDKFAYDQKALEQEADPIQVAVDLVQAAFNQVCSTGDQAFIDRYYDFLRKNRADLKAGPGDPLYNAKDPTQE